MPENFLELIERAKEDAALRMVSKHRQGDATERFFMGVIRVADDSKR